ncbi:hypothetical protein EW026_g7559 [Hermanssonia centrifuga]|uniref:Uncharacterized protein n=1 Tax=Hermanssonia centrifuga TaxID=98765 RepID=A0A4S4K8H0_9APHY|nr:hypothetical protein EW026_g7559 [Hermanssonia centrifuga]
MRGFAQDSEDPLTRALAPPPNESPNEREQRLRAEAEAQRKSDQIDEVLKAERATLKKRKIMRMLLLGQSESGKSTTLKNMQLTYAPRAWAAERVSWRAVIQLNLIRSVNAILDALEVELSNNVHYQTPIHSRAASPGSPISDEDDPYELAEVHIPQESKPSLMKLKLRLGPLRQVEIDLKARLGDGTEELTESTLARSSAVMAATPFDAAPNPLQSLSTRRSKEVIVRSHQSWKDKEKERKEKDRNSVRPATTGTTDGDRDSATDVLAGCADDLLSLSSDPIIQEIVERKKVLSGQGESAE